MKKNVLLLALASTLFAGCATYSYTDAPASVGFIYSKYAVKGYSGDFQPIEDVGIVTTDGMIKIQSVDGNRVNTLTILKSSGMYANGRYQLHLLPGDHKIEMAFISEFNGVRTWSTSNVTKDITIQKGQVIHLSKVENGKSWSAHASDGSRDLQTIKADYQSLLEKESKK